MQSPFVLIIFGATGDLARSKLIPALFSLYKQKLFPETFYIVGFARRPLGLYQTVRPLADEEFRKMMADGDSDWEKFSQNLYYQQGMFDQESGYEQLIEKLNQFDKKMGACITRIFYLATPPQHYETILDFLQNTKLSEGCGPASAYLASRPTPTQARGASAGKHGGSSWTKIAIEKPFGKDLETAQALDKKLATIFEEKQIFRVDHYLGKETVQNMLAFRFANGIFEPVWNKNYIDHVQITFAETSGVEKRGEFFDGVGMLRDAGQNHLMQLITAVAMEQPSSFTKEGVRDARANVLKALRCFNGEGQNMVVRGQYEGYKNIKGVMPNSQTETFVAFKAFIDTPRFSGVPFYVRAGKKMPKDIVEISIVFIQTCHILFKEFGCPEEGNVLTIRIQPDEGIILRVIAKKPGSKLSLGTVNMKFTYQEEFGEKGQDAYEKLLLDIFTGDQMLFNRSDELESSWRFITDMLKHWQQEKTVVLEYQPGTWGPKEADDLISRDGKKWL